MVIFVLFVVGCNSNPGPDFSNPKMPESYQEITYEIHQKDGYEMKSTTIKHEEDYDLFEEWKKRQENLENQAKYEMVRASMQENREISKMERNLEKYCNSLQSNSCLQMKTLEVRGGCKEIEISCDRFDSRDICLRHEVKIKGERKPASEC